MKDPHHPLVGRLTLAYEILHPDEPDQTLIAHHAEPGSASAESLRLPASWAADMPAPLDG